MLKEKESVIRKAMIVFDAFILTFTFLFAYSLRQNFHIIYNLDIMPSTQIVSGTVASFSYYLIFLFMAVLIWCFLLYFNGLYRSFRTRRLRELILIILKSSFLVILALGTFIFLFKLHLISRIFFLFFIILGTIFLVIERIVVYLSLHYSRRRGFNYRRLLIVGTGRRAVAIIRKIRNHPEWGFRIIGAINDESARKVEKVDNIEVIGTLEDFTEILHRCAVDQVIFVVPRLRLNHIENAIYSCETEGVKATISVDLFDLTVAKSIPTELDGIPLISFETTSDNEWQLFMKRSMDIVFSGLGLLLLTPLYSIVALLIKLSSKGPVLFKQKRIGLNGREFIFYKFRTMYSGSEKRRTELETLNEMDGPVFKIKKDPRITPVGRILRKFSIDELPQFLNVFLGHMSIVGPRPPLPEEVQQYQCWHRRRLSMRPGISCLWQISGRNNINFENWMKLDLEYLDNWSLWLDFKILIKTIPAVIFGSGAS